MSILDASIEDDAAKRVVTDVEVALTATGTHAVMAAQSCWGAGLLGQLLPASRQPGSWSPLESAFEPDTAACIVIAPLMCA